jgi:hypothetical protein
MSTKTLRKRIALVAVATLGAGVLSAAPAFAGDPAAGDFLVSATSDGTTNYGIISVTGTTDQTVEMYTTGQANITTVAADIDAGLDNASLVLKITQGSGLFTYATTGSTNVTAIDAASVSADSQTVTWQASNDTNDTGNAGQADAYFRPTAAGKTVIQYQSVTPAGVATVKSTITIYAVTSAAQSASGVLSVGDSYFARVSSATGTIATNVDSTTSSVVNGSCGYIAFDLMDAYGGNLSEGALVATSSSTDAAVIFNASTTTSTSTSTAVVADTATGDYVAVCQATANKPVTTTVSVSYNGTLIGTKSITILGQLASLKISTAVADGLAYAPRSSTSGTHFYVLAYDAAGKRVATSATPTVDSAGLNTIVTNVTVSGTVSSSSTSAPLGTSGYFTCASDKSGTATIRVKHVDSLGATIYSNTTTARCGGATPYAVKASLDKAVYLPGDIATLTVTATDVAGQPVADTATTGTDFTVSGSNMTAVTAPSSADTFTWGTKTYKFVVGSTEGSYAMAVSIPAYAAYGVTDQTVPYSIKSNSTAVSNADVLKAIVSLIASINKQIAALQKALLKR